MESESHTAPSADFWKSKLAAFLHDPPSKALDIGNHEENARLASSAAGIPTGEFDRPADWTAAAADRLPFPKGQIQCRFDGSSVTFRHPLCGKELPLPEMTAAKALEKSQTVQPDLKENFPADWQETDIWRAKHFVHWRKWRENTTQNDWRLEFFPADTRIPDHSIWHHMAVVSALGGCVEKDGGLKPAFLKLQIGPVQDFIAAAKSVRDLWSGSYLLSWLMAAGLKALSAEVGPDAVIFPSLYQQPLFDLQWRDELWNRVSIGDKTIWDSWNYPNKDLLVPNLPNVFLALVPANRSAELGALVERAIRDEWNKIGQACWDYCDSAVYNGSPLTSDEPGLFSRSERKTRFEKQASQFLQTSWVAEPWPEKVEAALDLASKFDPEMPIQQAAQRIQKVVEMATQQMPIDHRDARYYEDRESKTGLNNVGLAWATILQFTNWKLDAVRQTRAFPAWAEGGWDNGTANNKDALNGREEAVAGGKNWRTQCEKMKGVWSSLFKTDAWVGASTLIKRVWHLAYLQNQIGLHTDSESFPMPDTREIALGQPEQDEGDDTHDTDRSDRYFAVLALDGDEIGKWISGEKNARFSDLLAPPAGEYFRNPCFKNFLETRRPLSPGFHLQFSETLSNFAQKVVPGIIRHYRGRLIYAGGDDVLAMLPAENAMDCARDLRSAFQGKNPAGLQSFQSPAFGFLQSNRYRESTGASDASNETCIPFPVPGPEADVSVGIAVAHFKHPLQDVVREAQAAEKRAKKDLGRAALSLSILKRSGEILHWGCKWTGGGIDLFAAIANAMSDSEASPSLSGKFPHRVCELLTPYLCTQSGISKVAEAPAFPAKEIVQREFEFAARQQGDPSIMLDLRPLLETYLEKLDPHKKPNLQTAAADPRPAEKEGDPIQSVIGLCRSVAFAHRTRSGK
jgi:CRISPR-associated protein Cas10/Cmr2 subtype III-B